MRDLLLTYHDQTSKRLKDVYFEGNIFNPPKYILYNGCLFKYTGSGGGVKSTNFYHEEVDFQVVLENQDEK